MRVRDLQRMLKSFPVNAKVIAHVINDEGWTIGTVQPIIGRWEDKKGRRTKEVLLRVTIPNKLEEYKD